MPARNLRGALALAVLSFGCTKAAPTTESVIASVRNAIDPLQRYEARIATEVFSEPSPARTSTSPILRGTSWVRGELPNHLRVVYGPSDQGGPVFDAIFDGAVQWTSVTAGQNSRVLRLDQKKLARQTPFDTGYVLQGSGLDRGEDLLGTWRRFFADYRYAGPVERIEIDGEPALQIHGTLTPERAMMEIEPQLAQFMGTSSDDAEQEKQWTEMFAQLIVSLGTSSLAIAERDHLPRRWTVGPSSRDPILRATVTSLAIDPRFGPEVFGPPAGAVGAEDVTAQVSETRTQEAKGRADPEKLAAACKRVVAEVERRRAKQSQ